MNDKQHKHKRGWDKLAFFKDPNSNVAIQVNRNGGRYTMQICMEVVEGKLDKFIPVPAEGAQNPLEDIVFSLTKRAVEEIEKDKKKKSKSGDKKEYRKKEKKGPTGLSQLAKKDSVKAQERAGKDAKPYVGRTARKKEQKKSG